jgi:hypothetical protein
MQGFLGSFRARATKRSEAVLSLANELLAYRSARAALTGPALADWTVRYEENLRQLVAHAVDSLNDVFDSGSWLTGIEMLSETSTSVKCEELMANVQASIATEFGDQAAASIAPLTTMLSGITVATTPSSGGVRVALSHDGQKPITFSLSSQRATGDIARTSSADLLAGGPPLMVGRMKGLRESVINGSTDLGAVDFYGAFIWACSLLIGNARSEVRATQRYGRVRVQGEAPILIALAIFVAVVAALWVNYELWCTGDIISGNAPNKQSTACDIFEGIATFLSIIGIFIFWASAGASGGYTNPIAPNYPTYYNVNPPLTS